MMGLRVGLARRMKAIRVSDVMRYEHIIMDAKRLSSMLLCNSAHEMSAALAILRAEFVLILE
jgi:hypothetical protein